jgi:basic membrane lipoprotein Med (substrate-binding protein (PBP1-ABC) superfamily)
MLKDMIATRVAGEKGGKAYDISLKNGSLKLVFNSKVKVPDEVMKAAKDTMQKIIDGSLIVVGSPAAMAAATAAPTMAATASK